jgi:hypothetical protein
MTADAALESQGLGHDEPAWLAEVRLRAARRVLWLRHLWTEHAYPDEHLLAISHSEVDRALAPRADQEAAELAFYAGDERAAGLTRDLAATRHDPRLDHLVTTFALTPMETALLTLGLAAASDGAIARVLGYLSDSTQAADPTPALAAALFDLAGHQAPAPDSPLVTWQLASPQAPAAEISAWSTAWCADACLLPALTGKALSIRQMARSRRAASAAADWSAGCCGHQVDPPEGPPLRADAVGEIVTFVRALSGQTPAVPIEIELAGAPGSGRTTLAAQVAARLRTKLVAVDAEAIAARPDPAAAATREVRRARLDGSFLAWQNADALPGLVPLAPLTFFCVAAPRPGTGTGDSVRRSVTCGPIGRRERLALWAAQAQGPAPPAPRTP